MSEEEFVDVPYVQRTFAKGKERLYFRKGGFREGPLASPFGSQALKDEVDAILARLEGLTAAQKPKPGTVGGMLRAYAGHIENGQRTSASANFLGLARSTQALYQDCVDELVDDCGDHPLKDVTRGWVGEMRDAWAMRGHRVANVRLSVLANALDPAIEDGRIEADPFARLKRAKTPRGKGEAHPIWTLAEVNIAVDDAIERGLPGLARAIALGRFGGFRRGTICAIPLHARIEGFTPELGHHRRLYWITEKRLVLCDKREDPRLTAIMAKTASKALTIAYNADGHRRLYTLQTRWGWAIKRGSTRPPMSVLSKPYFHDESEAFRFVENIIWPNGPFCPHCGGTDRISAIKPNPEKRVRFGLKKCGQCKGQFTVRMGTIFEESKLPMTKWLQAIYLMSASKKGVSAHQLGRVLEITYKTAWFLAHRIREAMRSGDLAPFGQGGGDVEVDETYFSRDRRFSHRGGKSMKGVVTLVERSSGRARSFVVDNVTSRTVGKIVADNLATEARLITDASNVYLRVGATFADHKSVNHSQEEYVSKLDPSVHTNTVEGFYSIFKRGMKGVYQHCGQKHLHRYMAEFDFRYSNRVAVGVDDQQRTVKALQGVVGKRLTYRRPDERPQAGA